MFPLAVYVRCMNRHTHARKPLAPGKARRDRIPIPERDLISMGIPIAPFPFATDHPQRKVPYVTYAICALNILVFASIWHYIITAGDNLNQDFLKPWEFNVARPNLITLLPMRSSTSTLSICWEI